MSMWAQVYLIGLGPAIAASAIYTRNPYSPSDDYMGRGIPIVVMTLLWPAMLVVGLSALLFNAVGWLANRVLP